MAKCKSNNHSCVYHACMSDDCQRKEVLKQSVNWGKGKCRQTKKSKRVKVRSTH